MPNISEIAVSRLSDYLSHKRISISKNCLKTVNLNQLGFDEVDWGILIGEIQCDTMMMFDWKKPKSELENLSDIINNLNPVHFDDYSTLYHIMVSMWSEEKLQHIVEQSFETLWP
jgi:hypothetical protein